MFRTLGLSIIIEKDLEIEHYQKEDYYEWNLAKSYKSTDI